jgi:NitT/TauT family transport system substrate-binding protein
MRINEGAKLNMASVKDQLEWFQSGGYVDASVTIDDLVDTSYVEIVG